MNFQIHLNTIKRSQCFFVESHFLLDISFMFDSKEKLEIYVTIEVEGIYLLPLILFTL